MQSKSHPVIRLADYRVPDFLIDTVHLDISLSRDATLVRAKLAVRPNPKGIAGSPLILDGDELKLRNLMLDGKPVLKTGYSATPQKLSFSSVPSKPFILDIETEIAPIENTKLMGLYCSNGVYCTQCEAEGFRRITYFLDRPDVMSVYTVRLEADLSEAPVLLANGNPAGSGILPDGKRHFAVWHDPHPKPAYLFAIVGGDLGTLPDRFVTASGREVALNIYVEKGKESRADYAMDSLKRSMRWDEQVFGCEYDLDVFNIVAVSDFNMGAMENKGLNIFNDKYVLATPETATDTDYANIEAIIAHEYFHNWTGNRITCRDWFQLCLKEGLTVFRDQEFSSDMRSRAVKRIEDVIDLRERQFGEDSGPLSHPVRPAAYTEINNFYTATIYEKGAEVIRMLKTLLGKADFKAGMALYLKRCDGTAATVEEFINCFAEISGKDLSQFMLWYAQAGTPKLTMRRQYDPARKTLKIAFSQSLAPTPKQSKKKSVVIPISLSLIRGNGQKSPEQVFTLDKSSDSFILENVEIDAVPSILRGFSAPVSLDTDLSDDDLGVLAAHDDDPFNRWQAIQSLSLRALTARTKAIQQGGNEPVNAGHVVTALRLLLTTAASDPAFAAFALKMPSYQEIARALAENIDPEAIFVARHELECELGKELQPQLMSLYQQHKPNGVFKPDSGSAGERALTHAISNLLLAASETDTKPLILEKFVSATNMTDRISSLSLLSRVSGREREDALDHFAAQFADDALVLDKWFGLNASICEPGTLERVQRLMKHPAYSKTNPNRIRSLAGTFAFGNFRQFNSPDGAGYRFVTEVILETNAINPQVAARMATAFRNWRMLEPARREKAEACIRHIHGQVDLSVDLRDIIDRILG